MNKYDLTDTETRALMELAEKETRKEYGTSENDPLPADAYSYRNGIFKGLTIGYADRGTIVEKVERKHNS